jgi:hypothetical protein
MRGMAEMGSASAYEDIVVDVSGAEVYRYRNANDDGAFQFP